MFGGLGGSFVFSKVTNFFSEGGFSGKQYREQICEKYRIIYYVSETIVINNVLFVSRVKFISRTKIVPRVKLSRGRKLSQGAKILDRTEKKG